MPADGSKNLTSLADRTTEEQQTIATMGGKASGEARRRKKTLREMFEAFGDAKPNKVIVEQLAKVGIEVGEDETMMDCLFKWAGVKSVSKSTKMVDVLKFFEVFGKYTGQEPASKHELIGSITPEQIQDVERRIAAIGAGEGNGAGGQENPIAD